MEDIEIESTTVIAMDKPKKEKTPAQWHQYWVKEMEASNKRLRKYIKQGNQVVGRYVDERDNSQGLDGDGGPKVSKLNLFHKNVSTMLAMLYGSVPQIDVMREHADHDDDIARVASVLY
jgi:hypothetical protein